jgi:hypothetical protein
MTRYWQIAAGSVGRDYAADFVKFGMAFVAGDKQCATMATVEVGDCVLLKRGKSELVAAGRVVSRNGVHRGDGDKAWLRDYDGWDLKAWCYVDWRVPAKPVPVQGFSRSTIERVWTPTLIDLADSMMKGAIHPRQSEPPLCNPIGYEHLAACLVSQSSILSDAEQLTARLKDLRALANDYYNYSAGWSEIREHEARTFLVIPLLLALGWKEKEIKIEQPVGNGKVDVALFPEPFAGDSTKIVALIETKGFTQGLAYAPDQARGYAKSLPECRVIFVSNGYCYKAYVRGEQGFPDTPSGYLNILSPTDRYPIDPSVPGALRVLELFLKK